MSKSKRKKSLVGWMYYDKYVQAFTDEFYFKKPTTKHTDPDKVARKVLVKELP